eukprot:12041-Heterococcus_DN1.PRE.2
MLLRAWFCTAERCYSLLFGAASSTMPYLQCCKHALTAHIRSAAAARCDCTAPARICASTPVCLLLLWRSMSVDALLSGTASLLSVLTHFSALLLLALLLVLLL